MSKIDKLKEKFLREPIPTNLTWNELKTLLNALGFEEIQGNGSRVKFIHPKLAFPISLHKPHPENTLKVYVIKQVKITLTGLGVL